MHLTNIYIVLTLKNALYLFIMMGIMNIFPYIIYSALPNKQYTYLITILQ